MMLITIEFTQLSLEGTIDLLALFQGRTIVVHNFKVKIKRFLERVCIMCTSGNRVGSQYASFTNDLPMFPSCLPLKTNKQKAFEF